MVAPDINSLCWMFLDPLCNCQCTQTCDAVLSSRWTNGRKAASGASRSFTEMSDFILNSQLSTATHPIWQWLMCSLKEPRHRHDSTANNKQTNQETRKRKETQVGWRVRLISPTDVFLMPWMRQGSWRLERTPIHQHYFWQDCEIIVCYSFFRRKTCQVKYVNFS